MLSLFSHKPLIHWVIEWVPILLDLALKGFVILILAALVVLFMRRAAAALRHLVWLTAVIALLCLPVLSALMPSWHVLPNWLETVSLDIQSQSSASSTASPVTEVYDGVGLHATAWPNETGHRDSVVRPADVQTAPVVHTQALASGLGNPPVDDVPALTTSQVVAAAALVMWAGGTLAFSMVTYLGLLSLARLKRRASHVTDQSWCGQIKQLSRELGLRRPVCILFSDQRVIPMVWGLFRITVLLPSGAAGWSNDRRRFVLMHELAHARRWDCLTHVVTRLTCALYWFNPLVWVALKQMALEREHACDDLVLNSGSEPADYAEELLHVVAGLQHPASLGTGAAIAMAHPSKLELRLKAILDVTISRRRLTHAGIGVCLLAAMCLLLPLASLRSAATGSTIPGARTVHFPAEKSLGRVYAGELRPLDPHWWMDWQSLGEAQGKIIVPPGQALRLTVSGPGLSYLSSLSTLEPGDLQVIDFSERVNDVHLAQLKVLKGLEMLVSYSPNLGDESLRSISQLASLVSLLVRQGAYTDQGLGHLQSLKFLQRFDMGPNISDAGLARLRGMNELRSISLVGNKHITDVGLAHLADLPALESLTLDALKITGSGFEPFRQRDSLRKLRLNFSEITDAGLMHVGKLQSLETLSLVGTKIADEGMTHLEGLRSLRELNLGNTSVSDESAEVLAKLTSLEELDLTRWNTSAIFNELKPLKHLKHLNMSRITLTDDGLEALESFSGLESLNLPNGVSDFAFLRHLPRLEELLIQGARLTSDVSDHLATLQALRRLLLNEFEVVDEEYAWLGRLKRLEELTWWAYGQEQTGAMGDGILKAMASLEHPSRLDLRGVKATQEGFKYLQAVTTLTELTLSVPSINETSMSNLSQATSLKRLILSADSISASGVKYLADLKSLQELQLYVPEGSIEALRPLANSSSLGSIRLSAFTVDTDAPQHLKAIAQHCRLTLAGSGISEQDKARIEQQVPNCRISGGARVARLPASAPPKPKSYSSLEGKPLPDLQAFGIEANMEPAQSILVCFFDMQQRPSRNYIQQLAKQSLDLVIVAVQTEDVGEAAFKDWVKQQDIPFPIGRITGDVESTRRQWGVRALPWLVLTGPDHIVRVEGFALSELEEKVQGEQEQPKGTLEVIVRKQEEGTPIEKAQVDIMSAKDITVQTDRNGVMRADLPIGNYEISVSKGYMEDDRNVHLVIESNQTTHIDVDLADPPRVSGIAIDPQGQPAVGALVRLLPGSLGDEIASDHLTDTQGRFEFEYRERSITRFLVARHLENNWAGSIEFTNSHGEPTKFARNKSTIRIESGLTLAGQVTDPNGKGIAKTHVQAKAPSGRGDVPLAATKTDENGNYKINALPSSISEYMIEAEREGYGSRLTQPVDVAAADRRIIQTSDVVLYPTDYSVSGIIVDANGQAVAGAQVQGWGNGQPERQVLSDSLGQYHIPNVCELSYRVQARMGDLRGVIDTKGGEKNVKIMITQGTFTRFRRLRTW